MSDTSDVESLLAGTRWSPCRAIRLLQHLAHHPHDQDVAMRLSAIHGGAVLLHLAVLRRSRKNLRWHLGHILRNLLSARPHGGVARDSSSSPTFP